MLLIGGVSKIRQLLSLCVGRGSNMEKAGRNLAMGNPTGSSVAAEPLTFYELQNIPSFKAILCSFPLHHFKKPPPSCDYQLARRVHTYIYFTYIIERLLKKKKN
jgi:hypothetical protein